MSNSHDSRQGGAGTKSVAWVVVLVVILLALLVFPVLLVLGFVGFFTVSHVSSEVGATSNGVGASVSVNGDSAIVISNGVTITAVADSGQWNSSEANSNGSQVKVNLDNQTIVLENSRLRINDVEYGTVQQGDQVRLEGGRVTVNGLERNSAQGAAASAATSEPEHETDEQAP
jgi:hypothetical protein